MKITSEVAYKKVCEIEDLQGRIDAIYAEITQNAEPGAANVIRDAVAARKAEREANDEARALIRSFDFEIGIEEV